MIYSVPGRIQQTIMAPFLKKIELDGQDLKNCRPVSSLSYLSKLLEKVIHAWILAHLEAIGAMLRMQSVYQCYHSTEMALLKMFNDTAVAIDSGSVTITTECLLDLLVAFDMMDMESSLPDFKNVWLLRIDFKIVEHISCQ